MVGRWLGDGWEMVGPNAGWPSIYLVSNGWTPSFIARERCSNLAGLGSIYLGLGEGGGEEEGWGREEEQPQNVRIGS